ncbi:MAG: choice-of-anchor D domain-containing protein [Bacteroidales bacterium]|nr:choice-of-anchor D domain-containing protein [Bacteroidales bacterium]
MKRLSTFILLLSLTSVIWAQNGVSVGSATGLPGETVTIAVGMTTGDDCVAMQVRIPLGRNLHYVAGSAALNASRITDHDLTATVLRDTLLIYSYSLSLTPYTGSGELLTFSLTLGEEPGVYQLTPEDVVLSDAAYNALEVTATAGSITVQAPKVALSTTSIDFGHYPIRTSYTRTITVSNPGTTPLTVSGISFDDTTLTCSQQDVVIESGSSSAFTIDYSPVRAGSIERTAVVHSDARVGDSVFSIIADPFAVNELHIEDASGYSDSVITISLRMNNMDSIVGVQTSIKLPSALTYIDGSFEVVAERSQGHLAATGLMGDTLTMLIYNTQNKPLTGADGVIANFRVRLFGYGSYYLYPLNTVLGDTNEFNGVSAVYRGRVQIYSPYLQCANTLDMGSSPLPEPVRKAFAIRNSGNAQLSINNVVFTQDGYSIEETLPLTVASNHTDTLHVVYSGMTEGNFNATMQIYSNDANNTLKNVAVSGSRYEPNTFYVETEPYYFPEEEVQVHFMLRNYSAITAAQFDYSYPYSNYTVETTDFALTERANGQSINAIRLNDSTFRLLIYSMQNAAFLGNEGAIATATLHPIDTNIIGVYTNHLAEAVISNTAGQNKLTDLTEQNTFVTHPHCTDSITSEQTVCQGTPVDFFDQNPEESGEYTYRIIDNVCDTLYLLTLTVNPSYDINLPASICEGGSYTFDGEERTESGTYTYSGMTVEGCDSIVTLQLEVVSAYETVDSVVACDEYTWADGVTYTEDNSTAVFETIATTGCDSIVTLNLTMHYSTAATDQREACDEYTWIDGQTYTEDNNSAYYVGQTAEGCDSVVTLNLTIHHSVTVSETAISEEPYEWNGTTYSESGEYTWTGTNAEGCDSTVTLILTIETHEGIEETTDSEEVKVYARGRTLVVSGQWSVVSKIVVYDVMGRVIKQSVFSDQWPVVEIPVPAAGVYMVKIGDRKSNKVVVR